MQSFKLGKKLIFQQFLDWVRFRLTWKKKQEIKRLQKRMKFNEI